MMTIVMGIKLPATNSVLASMFSLPITIVLLGRVAVAVGSNPIVLVRRVAVAVGSNPIVLVGRVAVAVGSGAIVLVGRLAFAVGSDAIVLVGRVAVRMGMLIGMRMMVGGLVVFSAIVEETFLLFLSITSLH